MKRLYLLLISLFLISGIFAQVNKKRLALKIGITYTAGMIQGSHEANRDHPEVFYRVHGKKPFYNPDGSNKYKPGTLDPKFPGSTGPLVIFTDYYHLSKCLWIGGLTCGLSINLFEKFVWWQKGLEIVGSLLVSKAGFITTYNFIYHK